MNDYEYLQALAAHYPTEAERLKAIAERLTPGDLTEYDRGYKAAMDRYYARSNFVTEARAISPESGAEILATIKRVPMGASGLQAAAQGPRTPLKGPKKVAAALAALDIDKLLEDL